MSKVIKGGGSPVYPSTGSPVGSAPSPGLAPSAPPPNPGGYPPPANRPPGPAYPPRPAPGGVISAEDVKARTAAQEIIRHAQEEAALIRSQAEEYRQKGYDDGFNEGLERGKAELTETLLRINRENEARFRYFEHDLVRLAVRIAEKIIGEQLRTEPGSITQIVANALGGVRHQREIFLRVNPEDFETIRDHKYLLLEQLSRAQDIDIRPDLAVPRGGCRIESETGVIEATLEKQLESIQKILLGDTQQIS